MTKIGLTLSRKDWESPLAPHFGMAKWLLIYETDRQEKQFQQNKELTGRGVVEVFAHHNCTEAVFAAIGHGALDHLIRAGIRGWYGPAGVSARELTERLKRDELQRAKEASEPEGRRRGRGPRRGRRGASSRGGGHGRGRGTNSRRGRRRRSLVLLGANKAEGGSRAGKA